MSTQTTDLELRIRTALEHAEKLVSFTGNVKDLEDVAGTASAAAQELDGALDDLAQLQEQIQQQKDLKTRLAETAAELTKARDLQRQLSAEVVASLGPTQKQIAEQTAAGNSVAKLEARQASLRDRQRELTQQVIAADQPSEKLIAQHDRTTRKLEALDRALLTAKNRLADANAAVAAGSEPSATLARKHEEATRSAEALSAQEQHLRQQLESTGSALRDAGVDVENLDQASQRITQTFDEVGRKARAFADSAAKLNFVPKEQIEREAAALRQAYETLRSSGNLTAKEMATANLRLTEGLQDLERRTNGWKDSLVKAKVEIGAAVAAFAPIGYAVKQAVDFETALAGVRKVVDGTDEQFARLTTRIRELAKTDLPITAEGLLNIAEAGGQLGVPIEKLDQFVELAAKMSTAFDITTEAAGEAAAKLINVFDLPLEKVEGLGDAINVLGNTTAAKEGQILDFLVRVGGSAKTFGLTAEATAALGAEFISLGRKPEVAANAVNKLLVQLQTANVQSPKVQAALGDIGLSAESLAEKIRQNPQAALEEFLATLEQLDSQARAEAIAQILGTEYSDDISLLINGLGGYREALARVGDQQQVNGALQREFDTQNQTTINQYRILKNEVRDIALTIGGSLLPVVKAAVASGQSVAQAIGYVVDLAPGIAGFAATVVTFSVAMNGLKIATAASRVAMTGFVGSLAGTATTLSAYVTQTDAATGATNRFSNAFSALMRVAGAGVAGAAIGNYLYDQFEIVRKAGLVLTQSLILGAEQVRYYWEVAKAVVTDDTIDAAQQRHQQRLDEIDRILREQAADAKTAGYNLKKGAEDATPAQNALAEQVKGVSEQAASAATNSEQLGNTLSTTVASGAAEASSKLTDTGAAAKELGLDFGELSDGITETGAKSAAALDRLLSTAALTADGIRKALEAAINRATTVQDLDAIKASIERAYGAGKLAADDYKAAVEAVTSAQVKMTQTVDATATAIKDAFSAFGIETRAQLEEAARKADEQYQLVLRSGLATADGLNQAFQQMAEAQIKAAVSSGKAAADAQVGFLAAKAATDDQRLAVAALIEKYELHGDTARRVLGEIKVQTTEITQELVKQKSAIDAVDAAYQKRAATQANADKANKTATDGGIASAAALDSRYNQLTADQKAEVDAKFQPLYEKYLQSLRRRDGALNVSGPTLTSDTIALTNGIRDLISALLRGDTQPQEGRTVQLTLNIPGIGAASGYFKPTEADKLEEIFRELSQQLGISTSVI